MRVAQTANTKAIQGHSQGSECPDTNIFEFLILTHNRAYVNVEADESMCLMIMKFNTVTRDDLISKCATCSIALIQPTKRYFRTVVIVLKISSEIPKNLFRDKKEQV